MKLLALKLRKLLGIVYSLRDILEVEDHRRRYHWTGQSSSTDFVGPGDHWVAVSYKPSLEPGVTGH